MKHCSNCGTKIAESYKFCTICGNSLQKLEFEQSNELTIKDVKSNNESVEPKIINLLMGSVTDIQGNLKYGYVNEGGDWVIQPLFDEIFRCQHSNTFCKGRINNKWGIVDHQGNWILQAIYDGIEEIKDTLYKVNVNNKWGIVDHQGNWILQAIYDGIEEFQDTWYKVSVNSKWGIVNHQGNWIIQSIYDGIEEFQDTLYKVSVNSKWGIVDHQGNWIIQSIYDGIEEFQDTLYKVSINNKWGIISPSGNWLLQPIYDGIILFKEDYSNNYSKINNKCSVIKYSTLNRFFSDNSIYYNIECYKVWLKDKCGLIDFYGNWLLQPIYDDIYFRIELIKDSFKEIYFIAELNEKLGIINHQGGWVMQPIYEYIYLERKYYLLKHNDRWGFMDFEGNWIVQAVYEDIAPGCKEDFYLAQLNKRWGFVNAQGTWIVQPQFDNISSFDLLDVINNEHYKVNLNGKLGVIDTSGNWIMQPTLEYIGAFDGYYKAKLLSGKWGVADVRGSWIVNPIIDFIGPSQKGFAPALMNDRWGIISNQGFWLVKPQYEDIHDNDITEDVFSHVGHYQVKQNGKWGIVNLKGICVIEPKFDAVEIYYDGYSTRFYKVKSNGKYGYLNSDFNLQIPLKFDCEAPKLSEYKPVKKTSTVDRIYKVTRNIFFVWLALSCYNIFILKIKPIDVANYYLFGINSPLIRDPEYYDENYYSDYKNYSLVDSTNNYESDGEDGNVYEEFQYTENDKIDSLVSSFDLKLSKEDINTIKNIYYGNNTDPENKRGSECGVESKNCKWCGKEFYLKKYFYTYNDLAKMMIDDFSANLVMALVKSFNEESDEIEKILHEMCENFRNGERYDCLVEIGTNEDFCSRKCQRENN